MDQELQTGEQGQVMEPLLIFTEDAVVMMKQALAREGVRGGGIRMAVAGGGCKGFQYSLTFEETARPDDHVVVQDGIRAFLDPVSAQRLRGTKLDYVTNRQGTGFHFFGLDVMRTIGCGSPVLLRRCIAGNTRTTGCFHSAKRPLLDIVREVASESEDNRSSISHPNMRPMSICPQCHYVVCRCEKTV
jgi:iron-sulfur cluster assembly accessory protein